MKEWWSKLSQDQKYTTYGIIFVALVIGGIVFFKNITTKTEVKTETVTEEISCERKTEKDPTMPKGETKIKQECVNGEKTKIYEVVYKNDNEESRKFAKEEITKEMVPEITIIGTKEEVTTTPNESSSASTIKPDGYCKDGTPAYGNRSAKGKANPCYGHKGWK